jgi:hypothetical protein
MFVYGLYIVCLCVSLLLAINDYGVSEKTVTCVCVCVFVLRSYQLLNRENENKQGLALRIRCCTYQPLFSCVGVCVFVYLCICVFV